MNDSRQVRGVFIDLDGTMVDSAPDLKDALNASLSKLGYANYDIDQVRQWVGNGLNQLLHRALTNDFNGQAAPDLLLDAKEHFFEAYRQTNGRTATLYAGVREALHKFRDAGCQLACITNKSREFTLPLLEGLGILEAFDIVIAGDDVARKKPDPEALLKAMNTFNLQPAECLMIGDSDNDVKAAQQAGITAWCVSYGYSQGVNLGELDVAGIVDSLNQIQVQV